MHSSTASRHTLNVIRFARKNPHEDHIHLQVRALGPVAKSVEIVTNVAFTGPANGPESRINKKIKEIVGSFNFNSWKSLLGSTCAKSFANINIWKTCNHYNIARNCFFHFLFVQFPSNVQSFVIFPERGVPSACLITIFLQR